MRQLFSQSYSGRPLFEAFVIVASILSAFAIEAWWDEQLDRRAESEELARLHTEFIANRNMIGRNIGWQESTRDAAGELHNIIEERQPDAEVVSFPNRLLLAALFAPTFDVATPVMDALVLSGQLSVVQDSSVLAAIAVWQRALKQVTEVETGAQEFANTQLFPALIARGNMGSLLREDRDESSPPRNGPQGAGPQGSGPQGNGGGPESIRAIRSATRDGRETLVRVDEILEGIIARRIREASQSVQTLARLESAADRLIQAIEATQGLTSDDIE